jgi:hypothetical protein
MEEPEVGPNLCLIAKVQWSGLDEYLTESVYEYLWYAMHAVRCLYRFSARSPRYAYEVPPSLSGSNTVHCETLWILPSDENIPFLPARFVMSEKRKSIWTSAEKSRFEFGKSSTSTTVVTAAYDYIHSFSNIFWSHEGKSFGDGRFVCT